MTNDDVVDWLGPTIGRYLGLPVAAEAGSG
jgi:hypothetical protein